MKRFNKYALALALSVMTGLLFSGTVDAQRRGGGGGGFGGGGMRGGGSFGGGSAMRSGGFGGGSRGGSSFGGSRGGSFGGAFRGNAGSSYQGGRGAFRGNFGNGYSNRFGAAPRGSYGYRGIPGQANRIYRYPGAGSRFGYAQRSYFYGRPYYRGGVRGYYGRPYGGLYYNYRGFYNRYYYPRIGFSLGVLPYGYYPFYYGPNQYFYSDGYYYQQNNNQYTVVEPPVGAEIDRLPEGAESIVINGQQYYELNGVYYEPITRNNGSLVYRIAGKDGELETDQAGQDGQAPQVGTSQGDYPLVGDVIDELPSDSRKITLNGEKFYVTPDGIYLKEQRNQEGKKVYVVAIVPSNNDSDDQDAQ
ncbi:hypothetical protein KHS38_08115 [Mucilaginibacter sp. Bleaf8]|uniref:DUF6515 family protein n=1 Tax=Mucilaginibacter sp. Bleaf8 TaxID=2834430 RepID=UPI001BD0F5DF|nr:DUF6515 family protein [Mucilaginibacter sp. Bleaf8]MBS7564369.1 hypothetical protein [Mucilaginibacter sp. Bleaf8]